MADNPVSFCGFISFVTQKCISGYYSNSFQTKCLAFAYVIISFVLFGMFFMVISFVSIHAFFLIGYTTNMFSCYGSDCVIESDTSTTYKNVLTFTLQNFPNACCSCDLTTNKYSNYKKILFHQTHTNVCDSDAYINYVGTGIYSFIFLIVLLFGVATIALCISYVYNFICAQWEEYLGKKIDLRFKTLNGKQYIKLNVKDSNIITNNDIESGERTYYQTSQTIPENDNIGESDEESSIMSDDGVLINLSDAL